MLWPVVRVLWCRILAGVDTVVRVSSGHGFISQTGHHTAPGRRSVLWTNIITYNGCNPPFKRCLSHEFSGLGWGNTGFDANLAMCPGGRRAASADRVSGLKKMSG